MSIDWSPRPVSVPSLLPTPRLATSVRAGDGVVGAALFAVERECVGGTATVTVHGEVDLATVPQLSACLAGALGAMPCRLIVDLGDVTFLDCTGAAVFARMARLPVGHLCPIVLRSAVPMVRRVLDFVELSDLLIDRAEDLADDESDPFGRAGSMSLLVRDKSLQASKLRPLEARLARPAGPAPLTEENLTRMPATAIADVGSWSSPGSKPDHDHRDAS